MISIFKAQLEVLVLQNEGGLLFQFTLLQM